jgi:uncharacterized membrane protein YfcA
LIHPLLAVDLTAGRLALLAGAGFVAGAVNAVAGGGSLISYPALLLTGYNALVANVTNTVALVPGYLGGTFGYRSHLSGQGARIRFLLLVCILGAVAGAYLLVLSSPELFEAIVPWLIIVACALFALQRPLSRFLATRRAEAEHLRSPIHVGAEFVSAAYGAYFGAGLGIVLLAVEGLFLSDSLQRLNALKSVLSLVINGVAVVYFAVFAPVAWVAVPVMLVSSLVGGQAGAAVAKRLPDWVLRAFVIATGLAVAVKLLMS